MTTLISTQMHRWCSYLYTAGGFGAEVALQAVLCGLAGLLAGVLKQAGVVSVDHAFTMLGSSIAVAAAILLALGGWLHGNGPAIRIGFAVGAYGSFLLVEAVGPGPTADGVLAGDFAMIGMAVLCGLALGGADVVDRALRSSTLVLTAALIGCAIVSLIPAAELTAAIRSAIDVGAGATAAIIGLALVLRGIRRGRPLLRPAGLALLTLAAQQAPGESGFGLAGVAMLLITAVPLVVHGLRAVWREQADSQARLQAVEQAMACSAVRDHEMRNLVAGLSGAVSVLTAGEGTGNPWDHGDLGAAARIELERLRRILDSDHGSELAPAGPSTVAVGPVLSGLAALHGLPDAPITVTTADDPQAALPPDCLAHVVTNLLVNCARHAPGARVRLTACRRGGQVVIKVSDDGPGLPPELTAELLQPGVRGPSSTGTGLGLAVSAELVNRHGGAIRLLPTPVGGRGCTVVVQLPEAADDRCLLEQVAV